MATKKARLTRKITSPIISSHRASTGIEWMTFASPPVAIVSVKNDHVRC